MTLNPYDLKLEDLKKELNVKKDKINKHRLDLDWYEKSDPIQINNSISALENAITSLKEDKKLINIKISSYELDINNNKEKLASPLNPLKFFTKKNKDLKVEINKTKEAIFLLKNQETKIEKKIKKQSSNLIDKKEEIIKYKNFDLEKTTKEIETLKEQIKDLDYDFMYMEKMKNKVDDYIYEDQNQIYDLNEKINQIKIKIELLEEIKSRLSNTSDRYSRKLIHEECNKEFGNGNPNYILKNEIKHLDSLNRDIKKIKELVALKIKKAERVIESIIIDGNNLCHDTNSKFIGLSALKLIIPKIRDKYEGTIVVIFDSTIKKSFELLDIKRLFVYENIEIKISNSKADETIVALASYDNHFILSNDKYSEFFNKDPIINNRVFRHTITNDTIIINDLDINIKFN